VPGLEARLLAREFGLSRASPAFARLTSRQRRVNVPRPRQSLVRGSFTLDHSGGERSAP
jgi:hypothetical protein